MVCDLKELIFRAIKKINICLSVGLICLTSVLFAACTDKSIVLTTDFAENELMRINTISCYKAEMMLYLTNQKNE